MSSPIENAPSPDFDLTLSPLQIFQTPPITPSAIPLEDPLVCSIQTKDKATSINSSTPCLEPISQIPTCNSPCPSSSANTKLACCSLLTSPALLPGDELSESLQEISLFMTGASKKTPSKILCSDHDSVFWYDFTHIYGIINFDEAAEYRNVRWIGIQEVEEGNEGEEVQESMVEVVGSKIPRCLGEVQAKKAEGPILIRGAGADFFCSQHGFEGGARNASVTVFKARFSRGHQFGSEGSLLEHLSDLETDEARGEERPLGYLSDMETELDEPDELDTDFEFDL